MKRIRRRIVVEEIIDEKGNVLEETSREVHVLGSVGYANFMSCTNYLIQFFLKTEGKYSCTRMKLGKLLTILACKYARKGIELFSDPIYWDKVGVSIYELKLFYGIDIYPAKKTVWDNNKVIDYHTLKKDVQIPEYYKLICKIPDDVAKEIEDLFYNFGAYSSADLTMLLKPIMEYEGVCGNDGMIEFEVVESLDKKQFFNNKVAEYIFK